MIGAVHGREGAKTATGMYKTLASNDERELEETNPLASEYENLDEIARLQHQYNRNRTMTGNTGVLNNHGRRFATGGVRTSHGYRKYVLGS